MYMLSFCLSPLVSGCTKPPVITNGRANATFATVSHSVGYSCDSCYEMEGPADVTCLPNNTWSQPLPQCKRTYVTVTVMFK